MKRKPQITAVIYDKRGKVLAIGKNSYIKTHPIQAKFARAVGCPSREYIHAEVDAILRCSNLKKAYAIKTFRYNAAGQPVNAKPCKVCRSAIGQTPIKVVEST